MQAMANTTTSIAERSGSPARSSAKGSSASASAATTSGVCSWRIGLLELLDALAEQAARAQQQHQRHQQVHGGFAPRRIEVDGDAAHHADQQGGGDDTPERAQSADDYDDEGGGEDFRPHGRMHAGDRRQQHAGKAGEADPEGGNRRHVGRQRDAERADHVGILHAGPHHPAERGAIDDEPRRRHGGGGNRQDHQPIARVDEVADQDLAAQFRRDRERQRRGAEHDAQALLDHHGEAEGEQQAEDRIRAVEAAEQQALDHDADDADDDRRDYERAGKADAAGEQHGQIGTDGVKPAMGEIDDAAEREDEGQAERDEQVISADQEAVENLLEEENELHG